MKKKDYISVTGLRFNGLSKFYMSNTIMFSFHFPFGFGGKVEGHIFVKKKIKLKMSEFEVIKI